MNEKILVLGIGVSIHKNDGVLRFEKFCKHYGLDYQIIGEGKQWMGGDMANGTGGGQKINEILNVIQTMENRLIILCDTFDLLPIAGPAEILDKFHLLCKNDQVLFSSEVFCWPDKHLSTAYPLVNSKYKYLNSGSIMGYRDQIYNLIKNGNIKDNDDEQRFFTLKYLSGENIILDHKCEIFQAINGATNDIVLHKNRIYNKYTNSYPIFIHGNGSSKLFLNYLENYIEPDPLKKYTVSLYKNYKIENEPKVFFALYIDSTNINLLKSG